jgi:hypothetical protein
MIKLKSNNIKEYPFQEYKPLNASQLEDRAKADGITAFNSWMLPQILAHLAEYKLVRDEQGLVDPSETAKLNITTDWDFGLWKVLTRLKRGSLVKAQSNPEFVNYSALVPLYLAAQKRFNNIPYRSWKIDKDCKLIDDNLLEAMLWTERFDLTTARILEIRQQGLTTKSGTRQGSIAKPTSSWCLKGIRDTELGSAPKLVSTMLTQIWVAHPSLRTEYMILDPYNWDRVPEPLVTQDIFKHDDAKKFLDKEDKDDMPW